MINVEAVTDFARAVGAVERAACERLRKLAAVVPADRAIVEIGAFKGRTTGYLALGASEGNDAQVHTIDPWDGRPRESWPSNYEDAHVLDTYSDPSTWEAFAAHMDECGTTDVVVHQAFAAEIGKLWHYDPSQPRVGLLWHDGPHDYRSVYEDLEAWRDLVAPGGRVVLHDAANRSFGVYAAAHDALRGHGYDWDNRTLDLWGRKPEKRGTLTIQRTC